MYSRWRGLRRFGAGSALDKKIPILMEETPGRAQLYRDHRTGPSSNQPLNVAGTVSDAGTVAVESETVPEKERSTESLPEAIRPEVIRLA